MIIEITYRRLHRINMILIVVFSVVYIVTKGKLFIHEIVLLILLLISPLIFSLIIRVLNLEER